MHLEIWPSAGVDGVSLRLGGAYVAKDRAANSFVRLLTVTDRLLDWFYVEDGVEHPIETMRDDRRVVNRRLPMTARLSEDGARFLREAFATLGPYAFAFHEDDQDPTRSPPVTETLARIEKGYPLPIGTIVALSEGDRDRPPGPRAAHPRPIPQGGKLRSRPRP